MTTELPEPLSGRARLGYRFWRLPVVFLCKLLFRLEVHGREHLPADGAFVLAPGAHRSIADTPVLAAATTRSLRYLGAEKYFAIPVFGAWLRSVGGFPVERSTTDRAALRVAETVLAQGEPLVIFPEPTRGSGPLLGDLKEGPAFLAARAGVPLVPVGIGGAERAFPRGSSLPRPRKIVLVIGEPIPPPPRIEGERVKRSTVRALTAELGERLQELFDQAQIRSGA